MKEVSNNLKIPITDSEREEADRIIGIQMYKCFGRTNFNLTKKDMRRAKKLREEYLERFGGKRGKKEEKV